MNQNTVLFVLTDQTGLNIDTYIMYVKTTLDTDNLKQAVKNAAQEYLNTAAGRQEWEDNCHNFNYGDFMVSVPEEICNRHGFTVLSNGFRIIRDDYNTTLAEPNSPDKQAATFDNM